MHPTCIIKHAEIEGPGLIEQCLEEKKLPYEIVALHLGMALPDPEAVGPIVLMGGPMNVYEEERYPFLNREDLFIKEAIQRGKPVLGICLGSQLIAKALGARVFKAPRKEIGWYDVSLTGEGSTDPLFRAFPKSFPVFQWHEDTFDIPRGAKLLATSDAVPHQAFRYAENAYGLQFHLEVTEVMIREWVDSCEEELPLRGDQMIAESGSRIRAHEARVKTFFSEFFSPMGSSLTEASLFNPRER
jgi:GMP synthase (glutamine-hydrolysing)